MEDRLVVMIQEPSARDRLEVPISVLANAEGLHPHDVVLELEELTISRCSLDGQPWVDVSSADVEEERAFRFYHALQLRPDLLEPGEICGSRRAIVIRGVGKVDV